MNGIVLVNKPQNITSFGVCARLRRIFDTKKIGHTGTLDPMAQGLLVVCLGNTSKLIDYIKPANKKYIAGIKFGYTSDTQDVWGDVAKQCEPRFSLEDFERAVEAQTGNINQITPMYSARKVNGRALYSYARNNEEIEVPKKEITVESIKIVQVNLPYEALIEVECSKGTYIRTICDEIGRSLGCGAVMSSLIRTSTDGFDIEDAYSLEELEALYEEGNVLDAVSDSENFVMHLPKISLWGEFMHSVENGAPIKAKYAKFSEEIAENQTARLYVNDKFVSLAVLENDRIRPRKVLT